MFMMFAFVMVLALASCKDDKVKTASTAEAAPAVATNNKANALKNNAATKPVPAVPTGPTTSINFPQSTFNFGEIMDGEKVEHIFEFTNSGNEPLVIADAKGSCGCTVPVWPKEPIKPGEKGEIKVVYNSKGKGKVGGKSETKTVTIKANTDPVETRIIIKGIVNKEEQK